jgi:flagellar hook assembly protein FlgD
MPSSTTRRAATTAAAAAVILSMTPIAAEAATLDLPAGTACAFDLRIDISVNPNRVTKEFRDENGNLVRTISAGKGNTLVFTNLTTGESITTKANGSVEKATYNANGTRRVVATGHNVIILFPTDTPPGPSTILYTGRVVYDVFSGEEFRLVSTSGAQRDLCAELAP